MRYLALLLAAALVTGCGEIPPPTASSQVAMIPCDDGGDGGVMIGGVCF